MGGWFSTQGFMPHGHCFLWKPELVWLHVLSDGGIFLAYITIPASLVYFIRMRHDVPFDWIFRCFGMFIVSCGLTHLMEVWTLWNPTYWLSGGVKLFTAFVSLLTAALLMRLMPRAIALPSPTQLRQVAAALEASEARFRAAAERFRGLLEAAPDAMVIVEPDGAIQLVNAQTERLFGYTREELVGQSVDVLVPERYRSRHPAEHGSYLSGSRARDMGGAVDLYGLRKDGSEFPAEISSSPIETPSGTLLTAAVRDISERKRLEELRRRSLEDANRLKSEFLANMSHELRTPLNAVIGFAKLMHCGRVGAVSDEQREYLGDILTSSNHLLQLINDVLDLSKVEAGHMDFFPEPIDLPQLIGEVRDTVRALAAAKQIKLEVDVADDCVGLELDAAKLKQLLYNYVSNALKFTGESGRVRISARLEDEDHFRISVHDTGIGIRPDDLAKLFVEFRQLDASAAKLHQGTGLGLALTKRIVEAQSGWVGVESTWGEGSTFFAVLPRVTHMIHTGVHESVA
jgi:PAS domain S-box-containing protein